MKKTYYSLVFSLLFICSGFLAAAQSIQVVARLDTSTIKIGEQTKLNFIIHQPAKEKVNFPKMPDSIGTKIAVLASGKTDTIFDKNDKVNITVRKSYTITAFDQGTDTIPSFEFGSSQGVLKSNEQTLYVQTVKVDTTKAIYDIKQPLAVSYTFWDWLRDHWIWVVSVLAVILAIIGIVWYIKTRSKKEKAVKVIVPEVPLDVQTISLLQALRDKKLWQQGHTKAYYIDLSDIIREYLEKRYTIKTHEKTTDEIFAALKYIDITDANRSALRKILVMADLVKFAKEQPLPYENEQSMDDSIAFVRNTTPVVEPIKPIEGGGHADTHI
jgi:hypothetical protein